jgi:heme-degrading monooxygenase HmoA
VQDFDKWKAAFDEQAEARAAAGSRGGYVFRNADDGNEVVALLEWDEREKVQAFIVSKDMQETMLNAGVTELPTVLYLDVADEPSE